MVSHRRIRTFGSLLLGGALLLTLTDRAEACSPAFCRSPVQLPPSPWMPGNLVYFKVLVDDPGALSLRTAAGEPIAASIRTIGNDRVFAPEQPITAATELVLEYALSCGLEQQAQAFEFTADQPQEINLVPAQLVVVEQGIANPGMANNEAGFVRLRHYTGDQNGAARALMTQTFTVDGLPARMVELNSELLVEVSANCSPAFTDTQVDTCGTVYSVTPGRHTVMARTTLVGQVTQPEPVRVEIDVRCPGDSTQPDPDEREASTSSSNADLDLGTAALDTTSADVAPLETRELPHGGEPAASSSEGGCSLATRPSRAASSTLAAGLAALL